MLFVHNPLTFDVFCVPLDRVLAAGEKAAITTEQAVRLETHTVFKLLDDGTDSTPAGPGPDAVEVDPATLTSPAQRQAAVKGGKVAEVTAPPAVETT